MVEEMGLEPTTPCLQSRCSKPTELHPHQKMVGLDGLKPSTSRVSDECSNQLSYKPMIRFGNIKRDI